MPTMHRPIGDERDSRGQTDADLAAARFAAARFAAARFNDALAIAATAAAALASAATVGGVNPHNSAHVRVVDGRVGWRRFT
jgi:hypothetical protein